MIKLTYLPIFKCQMGGKARYWIGLLTNNTWHGPQKGKNIKVKIKIKITLNSPLELRKQRSDIKTKVKI